MGDQRNALVTGGSRGIGAAIVERLVADGFAVTFTYLRDEAAARSVERNAADAGGFARAIQADLTAPDGVEMLFDAIDVASLGVVVNNASIAAPPMPLLDTSDQTWDDYLAILAKAPFQIIRSAGRVMAQGSSIINISTVNTVRPAPGISPYIAAKGALEQLTVASALELGPRDITVNAIRPGPTDTDMNRAVNTPEQITQIAAMTPLRRYGQPADIAAVAAFLAGPDSRWITGQILSASGGL